MPIPKPRGEEEKDNFISRCMSDSIMKNEYKDNSMRYAICNNQWDKAKEKGAN